MEERAPTRPKRLTDCKHFLDGDCKHGIDCQYRHSLAARQQGKPCFAWKKPEGCSNENCGYLHRNLSEWKQQKKLNKQQKEPGNAGQAKNNTGQKKKNKQQKEPGNAGQAKNNTGQAKNNTGQKKLNKQQKEPGNAGQAKNNTGQKKQNKQQKQPTAQQNTPKKNPNKRNKKQGNNTQSPASTRKLKPQHPPRKFVGIFWDIENCPLPSGRNPAEVIKLIRRYVAEQSPGFRESKFVAVLKITRYDKNSLLSLEHAGVKLVHVASDKPDAADLLLHKELDEFKDAHPAPAMVVLISGDIDFVHKLRELHNKDYRVGLIHNSQAKKELTDVAAFCGDWQSLALRASQTQPPRQPQQQKKKAGDVKGQPGTPTKKKRPQRKKKGKFTCVDCDREFQTKESLIQHEDDTGHGDDEYMCAVCDRFFASLGSLRQHQVATGHEQGLDAAYESEDSDDTDDIDDDDSDDDSDDDDDDDSDDDGFQQPQLVQQPPLSLPPHPPQPTYSYPPPQQPLHSSYPGLYSSYPSYPPQPQLVQQPPLSYPPQPPQPSYSQFTPAPSMPASYPIQQQAPIQSYPPPQPFSLPPQQPFSPPPQQPLSLPPQQPFSPPPQQPVQTTPIQLPSPVQAPPPNSIVCAPCNSFKRVWCHEVNSYWLGVNTVISFFRVEPPEGYVRLGDIAEASNKDSPTGAMFVVKETNPSAPSPLLAPPVKYEKVWDDHGTGAKFGDIKILRPIPPPGYVALGHVAWPNHHEEPPHNYMYCVHKSACAVGTWVPKDIWNDKGSGAKNGDLALWKPVPQKEGVDMNTFISTGGYSKPFDPAYVLQVPNQ